MSIFHHKTRRLTLICCVISCLLYGIDVHLKAQNIGSINKRGPLGTQINTLTGNFYLKRTDMFIPGRLIDIDLSFSYNSVKSGTQRGFGLGWCFEYNIFYKDTSQESGKTILWGNGRSDKYQALNSTSFKAPPGFFSTLEYQGTTLVLTEQDGWKYYFENPVTKRITKIEEPNGNALVFSYSDTLLTSITHSSGQTIQLHYNTAGLLTQLTDITATPNISYTYDYDQAGNLEAVTDPLGAVVEYTYLINGPMKTLSDKNNNTLNIIYYPNYSVREIVGCNKRISASYDAINKITNITDHFDDGSPNQITTYQYEKKSDLYWLKSIKGNCCGYDKQYTYDVNGNITEEIDGNGNVWKYEYDERGNLTVMTNPAHQSAFYTYSQDFKKVTSYKDFNGYVTTVEYDAKGNVVRVTEPENVVYEGQYDAEGNIISSTDPKGNVYNYSYDAAGNLTQISGPNGYSTYRSYDSRGNILSITDGNGNQISAQYDILNRLKLITEPLGNTRLFDYDPADNLISYTDPNNQVYQLNYDASNRLVMYTNPANQSYMLTYTSMDSLKTLTNPYDYTKKYTYDEKNRLAAFQDALGNIDRYFYDVNGNLVQVDLHNGLSINNHYDQLNNLTRSEDSEGLLYDYEYDSNGNLKSVTNSVAGTTSFKYDKQNRIVRITNELGNRANVTYDQNSNIIQITNESGKQLNLTYDSKNRLTSYTNTLGETISFTYDQEGNYTSVTDENGNTTHYSYDANNQRIRMTFADNSYKEYTYDATGNRLTERRTDGTTISYTFNNLNQITSKNLPNGESVTYTYDNVGRIVSATNFAGTVTFTYDALDRVASETFNGKTVTYAYNDQGRTQTTTYPDNSEIIKEFDVRGRLIKVLKDSTLVASYAYSTENNLTQKTFGNGVVSTYQYDFANRLNRISTSSGIQESTFTYDKLGNKLSINKTNHTDWSEQMIYDDQSRLLSHTKGGVVNQFTYDAVGNRLTANLNGSTKNYTANNLNQLITAGDKTLTYDGRGNLTFDGTFHKFYDFENRLVKDSLNPSTVFTYAYDAFDRRISQTGGGNTIRYTYADATPIEERDETDNLIKQIIFNDYLDPVMLVGNGNTYYYHNNEMGSVEALTNANGQVVEYYNYDTYGTPSILNNNFQPLAASVSGNRFGFTGQEYDSATGSYRFYFRNYSPEFGIFHQRDLIEYGDGMGMYQYVGNNPANGIDIWGLCDDKLDIRNTPNIPILPYDDILRDIGNYQNTTSKTEKTEYLKMIAKNSLKALTGQIAFNVTLLKATGKTGFGWGLKGLKAAPQVIRSGLSYGTGIARSGATMAGRGIAAAAGTTTGAVAIGAIPLYGAGLYGAEVYRESFESEAFINSLEVERYMWEVGATDDERVERILKLSKIREKMKERERRKRRPNKNPCDDGDQDEPEPYESNSASMGLLWSLDPNEIVGPTGVGEPKFVNVNGQMPYTIYCENDETATAPARRIRITSPVEQYQDPTTLQLGTFGFNNLEFDIPAGNSSYYARLDWRDSLGVYVDVLAGYDVVNNEIFWEFQAIDPVTLLPSEDPDKGVLLLQDSTHAKYGHGFVNFSMKPRSTAQTLDVINARAEIIFDDNEMIPTNIHTNTLDALAPQSSITGASVSHNNQVSITWNGTDDPNGSGIAYYSIFGSPDGVNYAMLTAKTTATDTTFNINNNGDYCFFVLATDNVGQTETLSTANITCVEIVTDPLPVTWLHFTAENAENNNILDWATSMEVQAKDFNIERSFDGLKFDSIGSVKASGNTNSPVHYKYIDRNVNLLGSSIFYYRIKQIDIDGNYAYSNIASVRMPVVARKSIVYPNPTSHSVNIHISDTQLVGSEGQLFDLNGKPIMRIQIQSNLVQVNLFDLSSGIYLLKLSNGETLRIIKQ